MLTSRAHPSLRRVGFAAGGAARVAVAGALAAANGRGRAGSPVSSGRCHHAIRVFHPFCASYDGRRRSHAGAG